MSWLSPFLLGRPGYEFSFENPPNGMSIDEQSISVRHQNLAGQLRKSSITNIVPTIKINSSFLSLAQRNQFASLAAISDTFLSFQVRDDLQVVAEYDLSTDATHVQIQDNSITRLDSILVSLGFPGTITINNVYSVPSYPLNSQFSFGGFGDGGLGTGTGGSSSADYFPGGSYDSVNKIITLGIPLPSPAQQFVYVYYTYKGWLVNLDNMKHSNKSGSIDRYAYDFQLVGA